MVPIYHPQAPKPSDAILEAEARLLERDGHNHVGQLYFRSEADAALWRRVEAEKIVEDAARRARLTCAFCHERIEGNVAVIFATKAVHPNCAKEFEAWSRGENDIRWQDVTDSTPVEFEGETTTWGELAVQDRKTCEMLPDGRIVGGYEF